MPAMPQDLTPTPLSSYREEVNNINVNLTQDFTVRILLVFSRDGMEEAENITNAFDQFTPPENPNIKVGGL